jgi:hypothetical protein
MNDLLFVYDKNNDGAGKFALNAYNLSRRWIGLGVDEPKPHERTNFTATAANIAIVVTPGVFQSEFVLEGLDLAIGQKKNVLLLHDIASECVMSTEVEACPEDEKKAFLQSKTKSLIFTFDAADQSMDKLIEAMNFKNEDNKKDLLAQADLRAEEIRGDILLFSSRVAKARLGAQVHRKYDFCLTGSESEGSEKIIQDIYQSVFSHAPALQVARNVGDKAITNMTQKLSNIRDCFNLVVIVTQGSLNSFLNGEPTKDERPNNPVLDEIRGALESELNLTIVHCLEDCPDIQAEIDSCQDPVIRSCLQRAMRFVYLSAGTEDSTVRAMLADPGFVKVDDNKTPRTRAAGVASFKLGYKNSQAMELAFDGRLEIYKCSLHEMKNKKLPSDVETNIKTLFELFDSEKKGRISWLDFQTIDRLMTETLGGQYSEMISRRVYSMMLYPGLTLESEISFTTFLNYHQYIAKQMGIFEGDSREVSIHYKYIVDKVRHMRKGKRFQKKFDLYVSHDRSKFSNSFALSLKKSIRDFVPNVRCVLCTEWDVKTSDSDDAKKKEKTK